MFGGLEKRKTEPWEAKPCFSRVRIVLTEYFRPYAQSSSSTHRIDTHIESGAGVGGAFTRERV